MITGINRNVSEKAYREVLMDSSSSLKDFALDRKKYYRKYILGEIIEEKDTKASVMGRLVETILLEPEMFDKRFHMSECESAPTGLMLSFVEALYKHSMECTNESGEITRDFDSIARDAYAESGFKIKYEQVVAKFAGTENETYYRELLTTRANDLIVVTIQDVTNAEAIVDELKNNQVTSKFINLVDSQQYSVNKQWQVEGYSVFGHKFKSMMDIVHIDHANKLVQVYDLKCVWAVEEFYEEYYLYRRAYIQAYLYMEAVKSMVNDPTSNVFGYKAMLPKFIVCDSINYYNPLIYVLDMQDMTDAEQGFEYKGRRYPGVKELVENLKWALDTNVWNMSRKNCESNGIVKLREGDR